MDESKADRPRSVTDGADARRPDGHNLAAPNPKSKIRSHSDDIQQSQSQSQRRRSVFDDSSSDDSELEVSPNHKKERRLTVNLRDAKHVNVSGNMGNLNAHK